MRKKHGTYDREIARVLAYYRDVAERSGRKSKFLTGTPARMLRPARSSSQWFLERVKVLSLD